MLDPTEYFSRWLDDAKACVEISEPTAMTLATVSADGKPSARVVLLKGVDARGFAFYTNLQSRKGGEIAQNPNVALCFYWMPLDRQVRIEGWVEKVSDAEADEYFASRRRESRIGAWASKQSQPLASRETLEQAVTEMTKKFEGQDVPRPDFWSGWRVVPQRIEFWQEGDFRLHDREIYTRVGQAWKVERLYP